MAGLYFHIPFCRRACVYCDFHFSTSLRTKERVLAAMRTELRLRIGELEGAPLASIYFGGGTPSLLAPEELGTLLDEARSLAQVAPDAEITLEANPDDVSEAMLSAWCALGINRVSLESRASGRSVCSGWGVRTTPRSPQQRSGWWLTQGLPPGPST